MATKTTNYDLTKPIIDEAYDIEVQNGNMDKIDTALTGHRDKIANLEANGSATDDRIGNRTISDKTAPTGDTGKLTSLLGWLAHMIKAITGKTSWREAPATNLEAAKTHMDDKTVHITSTERTTWNAKETTTGAQAKADAAKSAAITAAAADATTKANAAQSAAISTAAADAKVKADEAKAASVNAIAVSTDGTIDPNTTQIPYIVTAHSNGPQAGYFWHIYTMFYNTKSSNRAQLAIQYNGNGTRMLTRSLHNGVWTDWDEKPSLSAVNNKLDKNNPTATGDFSIDKSAAVGSSIQRYLGQRTTIANSPHQKFEIELPFDWWMGTIDISIGGSWVGINSSGLLTKRIAFITNIVNGSPQLVTQTSKYIEVMGGVGDNYAISDLNYNSTKGKYVVLVSMLANSGYTEQLKVYVSGHNGYGTVQALRDATMTNFFAHSAVYDKPRISMHSPTFTGEPTASAYTTLAGTSAGGNRHITFRNGEGSVNVRWGMGMVGVEAPGNVGGDFAMWRYSNTGDWLDQVLSINRSTGLVYFSGAPSIPTVGTTTSNTQAANTQHVTNKLDARVPMKIYNSLTTPVGASSGDLWFPPA